MSDRRTIWKFPLAITDMQKVMMPEHAEILCVQEQFGQPCIWAIVNPEAPKVERWFCIYGTGNSMRSEYRNYIGTAQTGPLVWHVFENV